MIKVSVCKLIIWQTQYMILKELEHRQLGWKVLTFKYDSVRVLAKKCDVNWLKQKIFKYIF